jgi:hypothetical protein
MIESSKYFNRLCYYNFYRRNKLLQRGKDICTGSGSKLSGRKAYRIKCQLYKMELLPFLLFTSHFFFWTLTSRKVYFVGSSKRVKSRLFQAFTRDARPDSNLRPAVQISNPLPSNPSCFRTSDYFFPKLHLTNKNFTV